MDLETYQRVGRERFARLARIVVEILEAAMRQQGNMRPQQIQHRAKEVGSLRRKLIKAGAAGGADIEPHAKDLAGARLVFYTNSDVRRFINSGIIRDNFEVDWDRTKIHHPTAENAAATDLFVSNNYVVRLKDDRLRLPDYADFADMWCEVQIQTTLNHAWAEMAHDTIYKRPDLEGFGAELMQGIEARMKDIMQRLLAPAGYAFDKVALDFARLAKGQELFEAGFARSIEASQTNNELHEAITKFSGSVLPYVNDYEAVAAEIVDAVVSAIRRSRELPEQARETPFGNLRGKSPLDVAKAGAALIGQMRFIDSERIFAIYCDLFLFAHSSEEKDVWIGAAAQLAEHNIGVWRQAGPVVQGIVMTSLMRMDPGDRANLKPLILAVLPKIFATDMSGTKQETADTIVFEQGSVSPSEALRRMRKDALGLVEALYAEASDEAEREKVLQVFGSAMSMPNHRGTPPAELAAIVYDDTTEIITGYVQKSDQWSFELRQKIEHRIFWRYRHYGKSPPKELTNEAADVARQQMVAAIEQLRDRLNADDGFITYKLLVGFELVFPPAWTGKFDHDEEEAYRAKQVDALIEEISAETAAKWQGIIDRCAATESQDLATFPTFAKFLEGLATKKPDIAMGYLAASSDGVMKFLASVLRGLSATARWDEALSILRGWLADDQHLQTLAWASGAADPIPVQILTDVTERAIARKDTDAVFSAIGAISRRDADETVTALKSVFLQAVAYLTERHEPRWVNVWYSLGRKSPLLQSLDANEVRTILQSLLSYEKLGSRLESFLQIIASAHSTEVIAYLADRVRHSSAEARRAGYEALPYEFHGLQKPLAPHAQAIVGAAKALFNEQDELFEYRGGKLVELALPMFSPELEAALLETLASGDRHDVELVVGVLCAYTGETFLHPAAKAAVAALPADDELLTSIEIALEQTGVVSGEFGRVRALKERQALIAEWAADERELVRRFAERYVYHLEQDIKLEQRRSEERIALQRLEYEQVVSKQVVDDGSTDEPAV